MPEPTVRPVPPERREEFWRVADYAFHPEEGPREPDEEPERIADRFGVFVDDDLVSICAHYDFEACLRGEWRPLAGLAAVATPPEHRRQGHVRRLVADALDRWRGAYPLSALWPFDHAYYRQFGWATANRAVECTCPVESLAFARGQAAGRPRRVTADEWATLRDAHEAHAADRTLTLRRDEDWWRKRVFRVGEDDRPYVYAWERDGAVRGYAVYSFDDGSAGRRLTVEDLAVADDGAFLGLLAFLSDHDSQVEEVVLPAADASLLDRVADPSAVECTVEAGPMVRVVDVADALESVPYPDDAAGTLTLSVTDDTAPWNDDTFRLDAAGGTGTCEHSGVPAADADATVDVRTLAQLVVGYHSVAEARRLGDLSVASEGVAETLAALFPPETVWLRTFF